MLVAGAVDVFDITDVRLPRMSGSTKAFLARNLLSNPRSIGNTDRNIFFIYFLTGILER